MTRVAVIGNAGGGKTTLCAKLGERLRQEVYQLDPLQWKPGGVPVPPEEFAEKHNQLISKDDWIIDGWGSWESIEQRFASADTIIFIDHPLHYHYWWVFKRQGPGIILPGLNLVRRRQLLVETWKLVKAMWRFHRRGRQKLIGVIDTHSEGRRVIHIRSPDELKRFIADVCPRVTHAGIGDRELRAHHRRGARQP